MASVTRPPVISPEAVVWQPDEAVTACPLCETGFTWYYRKHHCRKCGRVVCSRCCSNFYPLPLADIVRAPEPSPLHLFPSTDFASDDVDAVDEVRTCDGCFSRLEQQRCRRMLGLDISTLDPRVAAQIIRDSTNSPSMLASPPPSYTRASEGLPRVSHGAQIPGAGGQVATRSHLDGQASSHTHSSGRRRRRSAHQDGQASSSTPSSRPVVPTRLMKDVVPLRYVSFDLNDQDKMLGEECPICFDEYETGQTIARLECWCIFHVACIKAWKDQKAGAGGCPLHFHD